MATLLKVAADYWEFEFFLQCQLCKHLLYELCISCTIDEKIQVNPRFWPGLEILF